MQPLRNTQTSVVRWNDSGLILLLSPPAQMRQEILERACGHPFELPGLHILALEQTKSPPRSVALQPAQPVGLSRMPTFSIALAKLV
jgi:hypothetical protein